MVEADDGRQVVELNEDLEKVILYALNEAEEKLSAEEGLVPFTVVISGENLTIEEHGGENPEEWRASARQALVGDPASVDGYVFVYDGYVELEDAENGSQDAIILEFAEPDDEAATVLCRLYSQTGEGAFEVEEEIAVVGENDSLYPLDYHPVAANLDENAEDRLDAVDDEKVDTKDEQGL